MKTRLHFFSDAKTAVIAIILTLLVPCFQSCLDEFAETSQEHDTEVPSIQILNPTSEEVYVTIDNNVVISGTARDNGVLKSISYTSSSGASGTATGLENWSINDLELAQGDNTIQVTATDEGDNRGTASIIITKNKYLTFLGTPTVDNDVLYTNTPSELWITVSIAPNDHLIPSSVKIIELDASNKPVNDVCMMYDDGNLDHGDEIKGDNVFSTKHTFSFSSEGTKRFRVSAKTNEDEGEVEGLSAVFTLTVVNQQNASAQVKNLIDVHKGVEEKLAELSGMSAQEKAEAVTQWLQTLPAVKSVLNEDGMITIKHLSGLESYVMLNDEGSEIKGSTPATDRRSTPCLPLSQQTRGTNAKPGAKHAPAQAPATNINLNIIQNKNVLIWGAYEDVFGIDMEPSLSEIFNDSQVNLDVDHLANTQCNRASLQSLNNYGIIVFDTHGSGGNLLLTREEVGDYDNLSTDDIYDLYASIYQVATMGDNKSYYAVTAKFFRNKMNTMLPNSVIFNGSCQSLKTDRLANALISKGAKTYLGFRANVLTSTCRDKADQFFTRLVGDDLKTTGQSYIADLDFVEREGTNSWSNSYLMSGSQDMRFYLGLINGDFEYGNLNGWNTNGDGRVITQLGTLKPSQGYYMGIVSTGLGYTEKYGRISQSFKVTNENSLKIKWNFLSEEFLEYVGSIYQDYLKITITDGQNSTVLMSMAIDQFASNYSLSRVSPTIVFDRGDVYMTGWQTTTFDISQYKGKTVTLTIETGDIGDSIFDSATLLDEISIY